jgi:hypothetical protein
MNVITVDFEGDTKLDELFKTYDVIMAEIPRFDMPIYLQWIIAQLKKREKGNQKYTALFTKDRPFATKIKKMLEENGLNNYFYGLIDRNKPAFLVIPMELIKLNALFNNQKKEQKK